MARTVRPRADGSGTMCRVKPLSADVRLPSSDRGPLDYLLRRLAVAVGLIVFVAMVAYVDRDGYRDGDTTGIGLLDAFYYSTVSVTTTGYGDITPATDRARLVSTLLVTPARVLFLIILVGTTLEILAGRVHAQFRENRWRKTLEDHTIICGFGVKGLVAAETVLAHGVTPERLVVIDPRADVVEDARRRGFAGVVGDASSSTVLRAAGVTRAASVIVAPDRDDTAVLITLTARELNRGATIVAAVRDNENAHLLEQGGAGLGDRVLRRRRAAAGPGRPEPAHRARAGGPAQRGAGARRDRAAR